MLNYQPHRKSKSAKMAFQLSEETKVSYKQKESMLAILTDIGAYPQSHRCLENRHTLVSHQVFSSSFNWEFSGYLPLILYLGKWIEVRIWEAVLILNRLYPEWTEAIADQVYLPWPLRVSLTWVGSFRLLVDHQHLSTLETGSFLLEYWRLKAGISGHMSVEEKNWFLKLVAE